MRTLRILLGCSHAPLPEGSAAGRWCYVLLRGLQQRGHRVTAFAACPSAAEARAAGECFPAPEYNLRCYTAAPRHGVAGKLETLRRPHAYPFPQEMLREWRAERERGHDIVHLEDTWSAWLEPRGGAGTVLHIYNLYSVDWVADPSRWEERMRRQLTVRTERKLVRRFPNLLAGTPDVAAELSRMAPRSRVTVVPLTLDLERYGFFPQQDRTAAPVVAMIGSMDWPSSRAAAERLLRRIWPEIRKSLPNARLQITGRGARRVLREYLDVDGVDIQEDVPSMQPYFERADLLLYAPESGSGIKIKVLEAFAYGLPVVTTPSGIEGLDVEDGVHAGVHTTDAGLVERAIGLLRDPARREAQRRAARRLIETRYAPASVLERLERVYATILDGGRARAAEVSEEYADRC